MKHKDNDFKDFRIEHFIYKGEINMSVHHQHQYYELMYILDGQRQFLFYNEEYILSNKNIALIPPHTLHKSKSYKSFSQERILVYFKKEFINRYFSESDKDYFSNLVKPIILTENETKIILPFFNNLISIYKDDTATDIALKDTSLKMAFLSLFAEFIRTVQKRDGTFDYTFTKKDEIYITVIQYLNENYNNKITLDELSKKFGISKYQLSKKLNSILGTSWITHINTLRISEAQKMLSNSRSKNILQIALSLGFGSITHFERVFKEITKYSPTQFINQLNNHNTLTSQQDIEDNQS